MSTTPRTVTPAGLAEAGVLQDARWVAYWRLVDLASFARIATGDAAILAAASAAMIGGVCSKLEPIGSPNTDGDPLTERETEALKDAARFVVDEFTERLEDEYAESPEEAAYFRTGVERATITATETIGGDQSVWPTIDRLSIEVRDVLRVLQLAAIREALGVNVPLTSDMVAMMRDAAHFALDRHERDNDDPRSDWSTVARRNAGLARMVLDALDATEATA